MTARQIVFSDNPLMREKSHRIRCIGPSRQRLIDDMIETMHAANGIGLAAIQVGVSERIIVVQLPPSDPETETDPNRGKLYVVVNPKLVRKSREVEDGIEGCLSVPGWIGKVTRHSTVTVKGLDRQGQNACIKADGLLSRVFQHEIDHCDGIIFTDLVEDPEKIWPVPEDKEETAEAVQQAPDSVAVSEPQI